MVVVEYRALSRLTNILENLLENAKTSSDLSEDEIVAICDILKALFNLTCGYEEKGTIHILRKQFYSTKINLSSKFFTKTLVKSKEFLFQHYILTKFSFCSLKFLLQK